MIDIKPTEVGPEGGGRGDSVGTPSPAPAPGASDSGTRLEDYCETNTTFFVFLKLCPRKKWLHLSGSKVRYTCTIDARHVFHDLSRDLPIGPVRILLQGMGQLLQFPKSQPLQLRLPHHRIFRWNFLIHREM